MKQIPVHLITGFLGSGKTSFLRHLLNNANPTLKIAIVQNEFAPGSIDGQTLKREVNRNFELLEFNNGSVFCVCLLSGFISGLKSFAETHQPELIIIETSGMSDPIAVGEIFNGDKNELFYLASVTCVVDALNFSKVHSHLQQVKTQLMVANQVIINKIDMIDDTNLVHSIIRQYNPFATIYETTFCQLPLDSILQNNQTLNTKTKSIFTPLHTGELSIKSAILKTGKPMDADSVIPFLTDLSALSYRVKGFIATTNGDVLSVQCVMQQIEVKVIEPTIKRTELIAIGENMTVQKLKAFYMAHINTSLINN